MLTKIPVIHNKGNLLCIVQYTNSIKVFLYKINEIAKTQKEIKSKVYNIKDAEDAIDLINKDFKLHITSRDLSWITIRGHMSSRQTETYE